MTGAAAWRVAAASALVLAAVSSAACDRIRPVELQVGAYDDCVLVGLGSGLEMTPVEELRLLDDAGTLIWAAEASADKPARLLEVKLCRGWNPILPEMIGSRRRLDFTIPGGGSMFRLEQNRSYVVQVRDESSGLLAERTFLMP